jgi:hypothetical protein
MWQHMSSVPVMRTVWRRELDLRFASFHNNEIKIKLDAKLTQPLAINTRFRQGSPLSRTLCINQIITEWK